MAEYYLDIETVPLEQYRSEEKAGLDPAKAKIISIQFQRLDGSACGRASNPERMGDWLVRAGDRIEILPYFCNR